METYAGFAEHADVQVGRLVDALDEMGVLDDTLVFYLLGDNGASGEGGPRGHRSASTSSATASRTTPPTWPPGSTRWATPTTYAIYPAGWALAMNTPYPWTKQVAHLGGTRDGMIVRWGNGIAARGEIRHQWHHVIDVLPTILEATGLTLPETFGGVAQQPVEGTSLHYSFDDADAPRPPHHAVLRDDRQPRRLPRGLDGGDPSRHRLGDGRHARAALRRGRLGALRPRRRLEPGPRPRGASIPRSCASCRSSSSARPRSYHVLPLDDRVTERENPEVAGRLDLHLGRTTLSLRAPGRPAHRGGRAQRQEPLARDHRRPRAVTGTNGVVVAQGGRFGGWSLYVVGGVPHYAYNFVGRDLTVVRGGKPMAPGRHDLVVRFDYDGGPPGSGADVSLEVDGATVGSGRIPVTTAYYFSFDETFNVGVDRGTPVVDDYLPVRNRFEGLIHRVRFDLGPVPEPAADEERARAAMTHQ